MRSEIVFLSVGLFAMSYLMGEGGAGLEESRSRETDLETPLVWVSTLDV